MTGASPGPPARTRGDPPRGRLADTLRVLLPRADRGLFLRALLLDGAGAAEAWKRWREAAPQGDARAALAGEPAVRRHVALLVRSIEEEGLAADDRLRAELKLVALRESLRWATLRRIVAEILDALGAARVPVIVGKGLALAESAYPEPALRHTHDVDLLVAERDREGAGRALASAGYAPVEDRLGIEHRHETGLPVRLHALLADAPAARALAPDRLPSRERSICGRPARTLEPAALLVLACAHAALARPIAPLAWAVDAHRLIATAPDLDWESAARLAQALGLANVVSVMVEWLAADLAAPVPPAGLMALRRAAAVGGPAARDLAIHAARVIAGGFMPLVRASASLPSRLELVRWLIAPTRRYLRWANEDAGIGLAGAYLARWREVAHAAVATLRELRAASGRASP